jgi:hypothetical protein
MNYILIIFSYEKLKYFKQYKNIKLINNKIKKIINE